MFGVGVGVPIPSAGLPRERVEVRRQPLLEAQVHAVDGGVRLLTMIIMIMVLLLLLIIMILSNKT